MWADKRNATMSRTMVQRLYLLQLGMTTVSTPREPFVMSLGCYLVQTSNGQNILIDSGFPPGFTPMSGTATAEDEKNVLEHLSDLGLHPDDIQLVICTHFDVDHAGYHDAFTKAEFVVQRQHYELARSGHERYSPARPHWDHPALRYRLVDGDTELMPGITLIETSGHALGHQSVLLDLPQTGHVLLAIDAVVMERLFRPERHMWPSDDNEEQLRASTQKLLDLVEREQVSLVVFGHDGLQWQRLKRAPEYYE
jgi:N-acyl homoserine lactone hydrolase